MKEKLRNKKVVYTIIGIVSVLLVALAVTYAYWLVTKTQTGENEITAGCLDITISGEKNDINLTNEFPMSDEDGMKLVPYEFTVTNNCNTSVDYQVNLEAIEAGDEIGTDSIKAVLNENTPRKLYEYVGTDTTLANSYEAYILGYGTLAASGNEGSSTTYELRIWIDADAPISEMNKTFKSKISVTIGQGISAQGDTLASLILEDAEINGYLYTTTPDFSTVTADGEYGIYSTQDDFGTSYYFRGDVENNYVQFGEYNSNGPVLGYWSAVSNGYKEYATLEECNNATNYNYNCSYLYKENDLMYWRIVRINGDGTIRLVYDGTTEVQNGVSHASIIGSSAFNTNSDNAKYVGYTYDDGSGNQVDSTIKGVVDAWYITNIGSEFGKYIADSIFCNDRSEAIKSYYDEDWDEITNPNAAVYININYGPCQRLATDKTPSLKCTNKSDRYTVKDIANGNSLLSNPVGLITADELVFAGNAAYQKNTSYYLYNGVYYWTSAPDSFNYGRAYVWATDSSGYMYGDWSLNEYVDESRGIRPVINLKTAVLFEGDGTIDNPYKIVME